MSASITYLESLRGALHEAMREDERVVVLGEDILDPYGGAFKVTKGLSTLYPERVLTTPICEQTIAGMGVGLALRGFRAVAELMFGDFVTIATDQIINHAAKFRGMYNGRLHVPLVIRTPMGGGRGYGPTHSQSLEKLFLGIPNLKVVAPSHYHDAGRMLRAAIADDDPVLFIENKLLYPQPLMLDVSSLGFERVESDGAYPTVSLRNYRPPMEPDVTVIAYGGVSHQLAPVLARMASEEVRVLACLPGCISPLDSDPIVASAIETGRVIVIEEGHGDFGWGAEVATRIYDAAHGQLKSAVRRIGAAHTVIPASKPLEERVLVSERTIQSAILESIT